MVWAGVQPQPSGRTETKEGDLAVKVLADEQRHQRLFDGLLRELGGRSS
jgi:hypothetical protein